ncbi:aldose epimerase [Bifidobacterium aemilianum]|uniref:Aldose epimerase n=1 Tax=Bifidobacterium aemilianum TaxID=2493120 RepID=A0A366K923_9BIFI|nr:aldose 1-epimerase family protein [Bifidobacterium aemilianum]RBP98235.1 aldose epimerase [Bifidobacterium aemilianum]
MTRPSIPPRSGQQFTISHGQYRAVITQLGAAMRSLTYQGKDLIVSWNPDRPVPCSNGQLLIPYPNRIEDGEYSFDGRTYSLPIDEHERRNAIHGYGYRAFWNLVSLSEDAVSLSWRVPDMGGYPFDLLVTAAYHLDDQGLHLTITAENLGHEKAPWALAIHPWLANGFDGYGDEIDGQNAQCRMTIPARTHVTVDDRLLPNGTEPVDGSKYDLRQPTLLTEQPFDDAWTDLERKADGTVAATFTRPDGLSIEVGGDKTISSFQMCTGTGFKAEKHPSGVAVEPQTAYANAFRTGKDLIVIEPGQASTTDLFIRVKQD